MPALLSKLNKLIINPIILLGFMVALIIFFFGVAKFLYSPGEDKSREDGKRAIMYGVVGMFIMFSVFGLIHLVLNTLGLNDPNVKLPFP